MAKRLPGGAEHHFRTTDHADELQRLQALEEQSHGFTKLCVRLACDLLKSHDDTGISLDDWPTARRFVEHYTGSPVMPNGV